MNESNIMRLIQVAVSKLGARVFRNQVGTYQLKDGRWLSSGLVRGASDLIGWTSRIVTQDMVSKKVAIFTAIEIKTKKGKTAQEQDAFIDAVKQAGGYAFVARTEEDAMRNLSNGL